MADAFKHQLEQLFHCIRCGRPIRHNLCSGCDLAEAECTCKQTPERRPHPLSPIPENREVAHA